MKLKKSGAVLACLASFCMGVNAQSSRPVPVAEVQRTQCDPSIPIRVELVPAGLLRVGQPAHFRVEVESDLDPDHVQDIRLEYELPQRIQLIADTRGDPQVLAKSGRSRLDLRFMVPDESRHSIRARVVVRLSNGKTISQTAVRWIDLGAEDPPEGMIGRILDPDGTGIRVYQGVTVRK